MRNMQQQLGVLGTNSAFAYRHRETKKNLCRGGRSQDLPDSDLLASNPATKVSKTAIHTQYNNTHEVTKIHTR